MPADLSDAMIKSRYASVVEPEAILCTVDSPDLLEPIYFCDQPNGFTSNGIFYEYFPFTITFGGASMEEPAKVARLEVANIDGSILATVRGVTVKPILHTQVVRIAAPDYPESEMIGVRLDDADVGEQRIAFTLSPRDFKKEPACKARYIMSRTPGLF